MTTTHPVGHRQTPFTGGHRIRKETWKNHDYYYYWDPVNEDWLSVHELVMHTGLNQLAASGFLDHLGGVIPGSIAGKFFVRDSDFWTDPPVITWISAHHDPAVVANPNCTIEVWGGLALQYSTSWTTEKMQKTVYQACTAATGFFSVKIPSGATQAPRRPAVSVGFRWRLK